jgi:16S rRNA processing protein RimM
MTEQPPDARRDLVTVGLIATAHGIRGELVVDALTDDPARLAAGATVLLEAPRVPAVERRILGARPHGQRLLVLLEGVPDRTAAEALRGGRLCVREEDLPELPSGSVWIHEMAGMAVLAESGEELGVVDKVLETGGDRLVLVVRGPRGEALVPFVEPIVRAVDRGARTITIRPIEGLLP